MAALVRAGSVGLGPVSLRHPCGELTGERHPFGIRGRLTLGAARSIPWSSSSGPRAAQDVTRAPSR